MTADEKMKRLSPSHDHFELVDDPWHVDAFAGIPGIDEAFEQGRAINMSGRSFKPTRGVRRRVYYSVDWCGNLIQEWGEDTPPGIQQEMKK